MKANNYSKLMLLILVFFITFYFTHAQTEKGSKLIGGTFSVNTSIQPNPPDYVYFSISLSPTVGYFLAKNFALGLSLPLSSNYSYSSGNSKYSNFRYGFSPFARYYLGSRKLKFFLNGNAGFSYNRSHNYDDDIHIKSKAFRASGGPGLVYFINNNIGVEGVINYNYYKSYASNASKSGNVTFEVGFQIYLPSKKAE